MPSASVFFVGQPAEVAHHAAPFQAQLNVQIASPQDVVTIANPGDLAIFYSEHFDRFRDSCQQLKRRNVATLYMIDGILEWRNAWENAPDEVACPYAMRPVLAHKVACIGHSQARVLDSWGNAGKTEVVGIPRLDAYGQNTPQRPRGNVFRILVMTAKTPGFTEQQRQTVLQSLQDLKQWHAANPRLNQREIEIVWRLTGDLPTQVGVQNQLTDLSGVELSETLSNVDAVITTPSTAMVEAMRKDLPVAVLDYHNCPHYVSTGWDICQSDHIGPTIKQMAERNETRMLFQRHQLNDSIQLGTNATERFVQLANRMLTIAGEQLATKQPLNFPPQILDPVGSTSTEFSHARLYPVATEFGDSDVTRLQVELSHSRREISHLHRELAQLQSELDQAHQIFEQIEKHPIAGPIVRIRQKMLDLMNTMRKRKNELDPGCPATPSNPPGSTAESSPN